MNSSDSSPDSNISFRDINQPFDYFEFIEDRYSGSAPLQRIFSQALSYPGKRAVCLGEEIINPSENIQKEIDELSELYSGYRMDGLHRITFWFEPLDEVTKLDEVSSDALAGYVVLKKDVIPEKFKKGQTLRFTFFGRTN
ncbi:MAG: hypothetical protein ACOCQ4_02965 [bacterium]